MENSTGQELQVKLALRITIVCIHWQAQTLTFEVTCPVGCDFHLPPKIIHLPDFMYNRHANTFTSSLHDVNSYISRHNSPVTLGMSFLSPKVMVQSQK